MKFTRPLAMAVVVGIVVGLVIAGILSVVGVGFWTR